MRFNWNTKAMLVTAVLLTAAGVGCDQDAGGGVERAPDKAAAKDNGGKPGGRIRFLDPAHAPKGSGWIALFNGKDLKGWHKRDPGANMSWRVEDGMLRNVSGHGSSGVDLISDDTFYNFETYYEYRLPGHSNSGYYLRGRYEIQILDSFGKPPSDHDDGALYSLVAPSRNVSRETGQWQSVYAKIVGNRVTVIMNGEKIIDNAELTRATGGELDQNYDQPGPIMLQGDHGTIDFRHIYLRPLPG